VKFYCNYTSTSISNTFECCLGCLQLWRKFAARLQKALESSREHLTYIVRPLLTNAIPVATQPTAYTLTQNCSRQAQSKPLPAWLQLLLRLPVLCLRCLASVDQRICT
jgi:hypothetical protein